ncbi:MAG: peptidoglycan DD-metalloendopeptidase family protein, partial [Proteobacteria bacterium]|nr:peptidoglycan DD-metalloendopeptidase family protein [Pseudomonadota bacterium]
MKHLSLALALLLGLSANAYAAESSTSGDCSGSMPADGRLSSGYGTRGPIQSLCARGVNPGRYCNSHLHAGQDIACSLGSPIRAFQSGTVVGSSGSTISIQHANGLVTRYLHLSGRSVTPGQTVSQGQQIGACGNAGASTGPHLHFETLLNGEHVNPNQYLNAQGGTSCAADNGLGSESDANFKETMNWDDCFKWEEPTVKVVGMCGAKPPVPIIAVTF